MKIKVLNKKVKKGKILCRCSAKNLQDFRKDTWPRTAAATVHPDTHVQNNKRTCRLKQIEANTENTECLLCAQSKRHTRLGEASSNLGSTGQLAPGRHAPGIAAGCGTVRTLPEKVRASATGAVVWFRTWAQESHGVEDRRLGHCWALHGRSSCLQT